MNVKKLTCVVVKFSNSGGQRCLQGDEHNRQTRASEQQCTLWTIKKGGSAFVIITLENLDGF